MLIWKNKSGRKSRSFCGNYFRFRKTSWPVCQYNVNGSLIWWLKTSVTFYEICQITQFRIVTVIFRSHVQVKVSNNHGIIIVVKIVDNDRFISSKKVFKLLFWGLYATQHILSQTLLLQISVAFLWLSFVLYTHCYPLRT